MASNKGILLVTVLTAGAAVGSYYYIKRHNAAMGSQYAPDPSVDADGYSVSLPVDSVYPLELGSRGAAVSELQKALNLPPSDQDGIFGEQTETILKAVTGKTSVASEADLQKLIAKTAKTAQTAGRTTVAEALLKAAMDQKRSTGNYILQPNKNLQVYQASKVLGMFVDSGKRLTSGPYDYEAFTPDGNVRIVKILDQGFMIMFDSSMGRYFYTSPYDWQLA